MVSAATRRVEHRRSALSDGHALSIDRISAVGRGRLRLQLSEHSTVPVRVSAAAELLDQAVEKGSPVYGVTTGFGGMAELAVPSDQAASRQDLLSLLTSGSGLPIKPQHVRAATALRAKLLMQGYSGLRLEMIQRLVQFVNVGATPVVREFGSIGASGKLLPLSVIAWAIPGRNNFVKVQLSGRTLDGSAALRELDLKPLELRPKKWLAFFNGTSFSSAIAANCATESRRMIALALVTHAIMLRALNVQDEPFDAFVHHRKPNVGQGWTARMMQRLLNEGRESLHGSARKELTCEHIQNRNSLRCLPQYFGPIFEGLARTITLVEKEMNAGSDNPLFDANDRRFYRSGNSLGHYVAVAMDELRRQLWLMAKHLDLPIALLVTPAFSKGLPSSLRDNDKLTHNVGLQVTGNSIMPMLTFVANPPVEHYPTHPEQFHKTINGLSWGAARFARKSVELFQHYIAVGLLFAVQAVDLQAKATLDHCDGKALLGSLLAPPYSAFCEAIGNELGREWPFLFDDSNQWLEQHLATLRDNIASRESIVNEIEPIIQSFDTSKLG